MPTSDYTNFYWYSHVSYVYRTTKKYDWYSCSNANII